MIWPEPTRVAWLALCCFAAFWGCERANPPTALAAQASSAPISSAPVTTTPSAAPAPAAAPAPKPLRRVLVVGDSLSDEAVGGGGFVKQLRERCRGVSFDNRAKGGFMVNQMRKRLETDVVPEGAYSHALVFGGVNDLYSDQTANRTLPRIQSDLTKIYEALTSRGADVIAITVTPWGGFKRWYTAERGRNTLSLNAWILNKADNGVIAEAVDAYPLLSCGDSERLCPELAAPYKDGLHFGKLGHQKLAEALLAGPFRSCASGS